MKKLTTILFAALLLFGSSACTSTRDIDVQTVTNEKVNLKGYKTYTILEESGVLEINSQGDIQKGDQEIASFIEDSINKELKKSGKIAVTKNSDFLVAYIGGTDKDKVNVYIDKKERMVIEDAPEAGLLLILIDTKTGRLLRVAEAEGEMKSLPLNERKTRIEYAISKLLKEIS